MVKILVLASDGELIQGIHIVVAQFLEALNPVHSDSPLKFRIYIEVSLGSVVISL